MAYTSGKQSPFPIKFPNTERDLLPESSSIQMSRISPHHQQAVTPNPYTNAPSSRNVTPHRDVVDYSVPSNTSMQSHVVAVNSGDDYNGSPKMKEVHEKFVEDTTRHFFSVRTLIEALSVLCAMIPIIVAPRIGAYKRGFFCNDANIRYPFYEGTVKPWLLYLFCLVLPFVIVLVGEVCRFHVSKTGYNQLEIPYRFWGKGPRIPPVIVSMCRIIVLFTYGFLITKGVTDICKYAVGRLRPHFFDVCDPDLDVLKSSCQNNEYIMEFHCRKANSSDPKDQYRLRDGRLSFLSGHASMAFFSMFFVIFYLESRLRWNQLRYCKAIIQFGLFLLAALTGMSRISDHKHHWTDVFAGALLGLIVCLITVFIVGDFFNDSHFLRYKLVAMLQKLDWGQDEGAQLAHLLSHSNRKDPRVLQKLKHVARYEKTTY